MISGNFEAEFFTFSTGERHVRLMEEVTSYQEEVGLLETVFKNGIIRRRTSLSEIRMRINEVLKKGNL